MSDGRAVVGGEQVLNTALLLGGIAPVLSGLAAMFLGDAYVHLIGPHVPELFSKEAYEMLLLWVNLQGGDALVAGLSRIVVALLGTLILKQLFAAIGIFHSVYELWLLPTRALPWCDAAGACRNLAVVEIQLFVVLHVVLVLSFGYGLVRTYQPNFPAWKRSS
ncbi:hypothetical protein [Halogeometricum borinquense]|uniref:hypothetical protein n=1 Tax=Halogeometricum borinquense TaxID=60847 RepID=UPI00019E804B|nr:hypothetical protein [Halogeometricum borinquense]